MQGVGNGNLQELGQMVVCVRCGKCCWIPDKGGKLKPCKFLIKLKSGKTLCRIYNMRLGRKLNDEFVCGTVETRRYDYEGCPFNTDREILC